VATATPVPVASVLPYAAGLPPTPWDGLAERARHGRAAAGRLRRHPARWLLLALVAVSAISAAATAASPYLLGRAPLLLMCLAPRVAFVGVASRHTALVPYLFLGTLRLSLTDPLHYLLGGRLGRGLGADTRRPGLAGLLRRAGDRVPRRARAAARPTCLLAVLVRPNGLNLMWAGSQRLSVPLVGALDLLGTVAYLLAIRTGVSILLR
jgi:hypothetical protein